jgi:signal transduction histidine kinase
MNLDHRTADEDSFITHYRQCMHAVRRVLRHEPGLVMDAGVASAATALTAVAAWGPAGLVGSPILGPAWLLAVLPLLVGLPLALRRSAPLAMWIAIWAAIALQDLIIGHPLQGLEVMFVVFIGSYSLGAHASPRRAVVALAVTAPVMAITIRQGGLLAFQQHPGSASLGLSFIQILAFWLAGVLVRARRQAASLADRNVTLQRRAELAAADERTRIARELHDIVAHHLSVIVLQAAGARAAGRSAEQALEKIEHSGRQALTETRRLLGVLRDVGEESGLTPQPGIGELALLADSVRAAGVPVSLVIRGSNEALPAAVDVSVYRIIQEALANVLKHAGPARAAVNVDCSDDAVSIEITDNGKGAARDETPGGGHGLAGMRERVAIFGGELWAGPRPGGGFGVRAQLPVGEARS